jgi:polyisoprenoid-binding protein YceI
MRRRVLPRSVYADRSLISMRRFATQPLCEEKMNRKRPILLASRLPVLLFTLFALISPLAAQQTELKLDSAKTRINWTLGATLHEVEGTFRLKSGDIVFNPKTGEASGQLIVDATSGDSGNKKRDADMNRDVLESAKYPEIVFSPRHVTGFVPGQASATVQLDGTFTIHGASHELTLTVPFTANNTFVEAHTKFSVPFVEWGMKNPSNMFLKVDKVVQLSITAAGELQPATQPSAAR